MQISSQKGLVLIALAASLCLAALMTFNSRIDPFCFGCYEIDGTIRTVNPYFHVVQSIVAFRETQQVVLGTSRGGAFPVDWLESHTQLRTLNLSAGGAEVITKLAFERIAREVAPISSIIWVTDYFEFLDGLRNDKFLVSPALRRPVQSELPAAGVGYWARRLSTLFDHNTLDASFAKMALRNDFVPSKGGPASRECSPRPAEAMSDELRRQVNVAYQTYAENILQRRSSPEAWSAFTRELTELTRRKISVVILIPPYHPLFRERLRQKLPALYRKHEAWLEKLNALQTGQVRVISFFDGLPDDGPGSQNWKDGDHFSCQAAVEMLKRL